MSELFIFFSQHPILTVIIGGFLGVLIGYFIGRSLRSKEVRANRVDAIDRSKSVILGEVYEKIYPLLPECPYAPRDMVFLGKGVDYIVFDGLSEGNLRKIHFLEVKSGKVTLTKNEKMIQECVKRGGGVVYSILTLPR